PELATAAEAVAAALHRRKAPVGQWDRFYADVASLLPRNAAALAQKRILLTSNRELVPAGSEDTSTNRRRRLSSTFMPPRREVGSSAQPVSGLPRAVYRRVRYLHPNLQCAQDASSNAHHFLTDSGLVREYDTREIVRVLAGVLAHPGESQNIETTRWACLNAIFQLTHRDGVPPDYLRQLRLKAPTGEGWSEATQSYLGATW